MSNYATGHLAEAKGAAYLREQGFDIVEINWKTKFCEIDIVARKQKRLYFTEVKYRKSNSFGAGLEYITPKKLQQMKFAAEMWVANHQWKDDYQLAALEITGTDFTITNFLEQL